MTDLFCPDFDGSEPDRPREGWKWRSDKHWMTRRSEIKSLCCGQRSVQNTSGTSFLFFLAPSPPDLHACLLFDTFHGPWLGVTTLPRRLCSRPRSVIVIHKLLSQTEAPLAVSRFPGSLVFPAFTTSPSTSRRTLAQRAPGSTTSAWGENTLRSVVLNPAFLWWPWNWANAS